MTRSEEALHEVNALCLTLASDEAATRALVTFFEHENAAVRDRAAREVYERPFPDDLRVRVASHLFADAIADNHWVDACAAKAALSLPLRDATTYIAPALASGGRRAETILGLIEEDLAARWRSGQRELNAELPAVVRGIPEAELVNAAVRYFQGAGETPPHKYIELGEDSDALFPFVIVGRLVTNDTPIAGLCSFSHQYAGLSVLNASFVGYGLVLADNDHLARLRETWFGTRGESMTEPDLDDWQLALGPSFPPLEWGAEALLVSRECDPRSALRDARVLDFGGGAPWRTHLDMSTNPDVAVGSAFTERHTAALARLGSVRVAYLWGNSD